MINQPSVSKTILRTRPARKGEYYETCVCNFTLHVLTTCGKMLGVSRRGQKAVTETN